MVAVVLCIVAFAMGGVLERVLLVTGLSNCSDVPCHHLRQRLDAIAHAGAALSGQPHYLAIGDSLTEWTTLPELCGKPAINGGIAGATTATFETTARRLALASRPDFIVLALGTNDARLGRAEGFATLIRALLGTLADWPVLIITPPKSPALPAIVEIQAALAGIDVPRTVPVVSVESFSDGVHLTPDGYEAWAARLIEAARDSVCRTSGAGSLRGRQGETSGLTDPSWGLA